jgi:hypothetical protein
MINSLFFNLIVAHVLGDFYLQLGSSCKNKVLYSVKGKDLWLHSLIIGILSWIAIWDLRGWWLAACIMVLHFLIDWFKSYIQLKCKIYKISDTDCTELEDGENKRYDLWVFLIDQILHISFIIVFANIWLGANNYWYQFGWLQEFVISHPLRAKTIVAMLLVLKPANILVLLILGVCKVTITQNENDDHGNFHSGELIGWLERGLMLLFVIMSQYEAIGFLIAAKSILRFNEASAGSEKSEYVLTGTLLSMAIALVLGVLILRI